MGKIIKRKVQRTFPWIMSLCLISSLVVGFSFNINFDFIPGNDKGIFNIGHEVQADTATTTVEVRNAAPYFDTGDEPEEDPASASTSPVNIGDSISFKGTGTDPEGDPYYLIICTASSASVTGGNPPTCGGGGSQLCISATTTSGSQISCTYNNLTDPGSETQEWYAFVCDDHPTTPGCSDANQGVGVASGSPVYVNHHPSLASVSTTVDNQEPGGTFTIEASVTDGDTEGGADEMTLYVCTTNSFTLGAGCDATTICTGSSTSPNVSCNYTDTAPTPDQAYTYYAFVYDWHDLEATSSVSSNYTIINVSPSIGVGTVSLNSGSDINLNIKGASEVEVAATTNSVTDQNGCTDLNGATSTMYLSGVAGGSDCSADDNDCYTVSSCTLSSCTGADDPTATYTCSTTFAFHTIPTDAGVGGGYDAMSWYAKITATDDNSVSTSSSYTTLNGVEVVSAAALDVTEVQIDFGVVDSNGNTGSWNASTTVINYGNTPLDTELYGDDLLESWVGPSLIGVENQEFSTSTFTYGSGTDLTASSSPGLNLNVDIARPTNQSDLSDIIYWGIQVPLGTISGNYYGVNTFSATEDADGNWN
ncbi:hypothetical protein GF382_00445 [Candidatus Falkowbacteria bacterium]|nr:hypothetical protein [Candidatus Falkowbacteria bacterium]